MKNNTKDYSIFYTKRAKDFFKEHLDILEKYEQSINELMLGEHPEKLNIKKIQGKRNNYYRIRIQKYRIIYTVIKNKIVIIETLLADQRKDVYKKMGILK